MGDFPDLAKTLEELENDFWELPDDSTGLVTTCHSLRKKPLSDLTANDLRVLIGQDLGVAFILPLALKILDKAPLTEASFYEGDLLFSTISCQYLQRKEMENIRLQLANLCDLAIAQKRTIIEEEVHEEVWSLYAGQSPEDFGLSRDFLVKQEKEAIELAFDELNQSPWSDFAIFSQNERHQ